MLKPLEVLLADYQGFRRFGCASIDLSYVASGRTEVYYEEQLKPWDTAAGILLVKEAGGTVTDYYNNEYSIYNNNILATNGKLHHESLKILKNVKFQ